MTKKVTKGFSRLIIAAEKPRLAIVCPVTKDHVSVELAQKETIGLGLNVVAVR